MKFKTFFLFITFFTVSGLVFPQTGYMKQFYREFSQVNTSYVLRNPSCVDTASKYSLQVGYNSFSQLSQNLSNVYFLATARVGSNHVRLKHYIGINAVSFKEGKYIHQERPQLRYSQLLRLGEDSYIGAGIALGILSHSVNANSVTGGETNYAPDGSFGVEYMYKTVHLGLSASQLFQVSFEKFQRPAHMVRMYYLNGSKKFYLDKLNKYSIETTLILKSPDEFKTNTSWWFVNVILNDVFEANVLFNDIQSLNFGIGVPKLKIHNHEFGVSLSYMSSFLDVNYQNVGNVELGLKYKIR